MRNELAPRARLAAAPVRSTAPPGSPRARAGTAARSARERRSTRSGRASRLAVVEADGDQVAGPLAVVDVPALLEADDPHVAALRCGSAPRRPARRRRTRETSTGGPAPPGPPPARRRRRPTAVVGADAGRHRLEPADDARGRAARPAPAPLTSGQPEPQADRRRSRALAQAVRPRVHTQSNDARAGVTVGAVVWTRRSPRALQCARMAPCPGSPRPTRSPPGWPRPATSPTRPPSTTAYLAGALEKPLLVEGPAGVGKTELAKAVARATGAELVRLQCYEGLDEARALYEWNYKKQLLRIQASQGDDQSWAGDPRRHLHRRVPAHPAAADRDPPRGADGAADRRGRQDRRRGRGAAARGAVRLPGDDPRARHRWSPYAARYVVLTSNATRELSEALKRRCLYLHLDYPDAEREREIVLSQVPGPRGAGRRAARRDRGPAARPRAQEAAVDRRVGRLGAHPDRAGDPRPRRQGRRRHPRRRPQARLRPRARDPRAAAPASEPDHEPAGWSTATSPSSRRCAAPACPSRWPRTSTRSPRCPRCRGTGAPRPRRVRRHAGQEAEPAADLRRALRRLLPAAGRRGRAAPTTDRRRGRTSPVRDNAQALADFREQLAQALADGDEETLARLAVEMVGRFGAMPGRGPGLSSWSAYTALQRVAPAELVDRIVAGAAGRGPHRGGGRAGRGPPGRRLHPPGRGRRPAPDRRGEGPRPRRRRRGPAEHRPDRLHRRPQGRPRGDAPRDLPAGPAARDPAHPGAPRQAARPARLPAYRPRLDLHRRRTAGHPPPAQAAAPQRARRALRRERLGRELRAVHAAAGLRAARPVPEGPRVHLHRPRPRGHPPLQARAPTSST